MRKRLITPTPQPVRSRVEGWLDVERAAIVEITSEEKDYPVKSAFVSGEAQGWRAAGPGPQTIRLVFDQPQKLRRISLVFEENESRGPKSSSCDGPRRVAAGFERLCASSGISARLIQYARLRNI